ncbi:MAG: DUF4125 family protein [Eubacterium sp.]|nr:DUF4125 family protein [Eubacterium sp.]
MEKEQLIEKLIELEYEAFDKTRNVGGRAACQNDWPTFYIMRKSQYLTWNEEMLESFLSDFEEANARGWNLITEKYARMMKSTNPAEYDQIKEILPVQSEWQKNVIEQIVEIQVGWMEEFSKEHPNISSRARVIHTSEDQMDDTSYETYLRGEIGTYSEETLAKYAAFIVGLAKEKKNLAEMIMQNTIELYGYSSFEEIKELEWM